MFFGRRMGVVAATLAAAAGLVGCGGGGGGGAEPVRDYDLATSPDGARVAFARIVAGTDRQQADLWIRNANGTGERMLYDASYAVNAPAWAPDGTLIAFLHVTSSTGGEIAVIAPSGTGYKRIYNGPGTVQAWAADNQTLTFRANVQGPTGTERALFRVGRDGTGLTRLE